jgi:hypothetical protein
MDGIMPAAGIWPMCRDACRYRGQDQTSPDLIV